MNRETEVLRIVCPHCNTKFRIGEDSFITTPEEVLDSFQIISFDTMFLDQPDIVERNDGNDRDSLIKKSREFVLKIRNDISSGKKRYWKCYQCKNENKILYDILYDTEIYKEDRIVKKRCLTISVILSIFSIISYYKLVHSQGHGIFYFVFFFVAGSLCLYLAALVWE